MSIEALIERTSRHATVAGSGQRAARPLADLLLVRQDAPSPVETSMYQPVLCLILRGRKEVSIGAQTTSFGAGECLLVSHDLPVRSSVTEAPYLALVLELDIATVRRLYDQVPEAAIGDGQARAAETHRADPGLLDALDRYLGLADAHLDAKVLGPLIATEIHYRLLVAPIGRMLRSLIRHDSVASAIARVISHIGEDLRTPIAVPELARRAGMSTSSFHKHFKAITSTTPLQYVKERRLLEARRLLRTGGASVMRAALDVGYESPSQFSREYARMFGWPPSREPVDPAG